MMRWIATGHLWHKSQQPLYISTYLPEHETLRKKNEIKNRQDLSAVIRLFLQVNIISITLSREI
jgi:hypothetical protein